MNTFEKHLKSITNAISVDIATSKHFETDFGIIRAYLADIVRRDPIFGPILIDSIAPASNFNCSLTFDFSRYMPLFAITTKYPNFIRLGQRGRCKINGIQDMPFFGTGINIIGGIITSIVRGIIGQGLALSGYFVRGHMGDIYELELLDDTKSLKYDVRRDYDTDWQSSYLMLDATNEGITLKIRLRVLLKFCSGERPNDFLPYPPHPLKFIWLAAADVRYFEYFSLCAPLIERELASAPENLMALRLLIELFAHANIPYIKSLHLQSISYELICAKAQKHYLNDTVSSVIRLILERLIEYLQNDRFPYYWDSKRNFMATFRNGITSKMFLLDRLRKLSNELKNMRRNEKINYEDVESFLGVQINSHTYNVDDFGIYKSFAHP